MTEKEWDAHNADDSEEIYAICKDNLQAILDEWGESDVHGLGRAIYKDTDCGPWLSAQRDDGKWFHTGHLNEIGPHVFKLLVGSIVEGSDAEVTGDVIDLASFEDPADAVAALAREIENVNDEACALWDEANAENEDDEDE